MTLKELDTLNSILLKAGITSLHDTLCILGTGACEMAILYIEHGFPEKEKQMRSLCKQIDKLLGFPSALDMLKDGE